MLRDVYEAVRGIEDPENITLISPEPFQREWFEGRVLVDERTLDECVNSAISDKCRNSELAVIMSDLPLLSRKVLQEFFSTAGDVVAAPGRKGGTNMLLVRDSRFRVSYHFGSFFRHMNTAESIGLKFTIFDSFLASVDIDEPSDVLELMLHGSGKHSHRFLTSLGFYVDFSSKDPILRRR
jgi:2-phospho-L-lactate guanylyltransferase